MLTIGRELVKNVSRPGPLMWAKDYQSIKIRNVKLSMNAFKDFVHSRIKSARKILKEKLFFRVKLPEIDMIDDIMGKQDMGYPFLQESAEVLPDGRAYMLDLMQSADPSKHLIDAQGRLNMVKITNYLKAKVEFQRELMKGMSS